MPLLEIVSGSVEEPERPSQLRTVISRTAKRLETWAGHRLLLDAGFLPPEAAPGDEFGTLGNSVMAAIDQAVDATPVVHLNDHPQVYRDAATLRRELHRGIAIRLGTVDLDEDSEDIEDALTMLLNALHVERQDVDLILDLGAVNGDLSVRAGTRLLADALRGLSAMDEWRNVMITGGAFPSDLSAFEPWTLGEAPRYDATLYDYLRQRRRLPRIPTSGYAVTHQSCGVPIEPSPTASLVRQMAMVRAVLTTPEVTNSSSRYARGLPPTPTLLALLSVTLMPGSPTLEARVLATQRHGEK